MNNNHKNSRTMMILLLVMIIGVIGMIKWFEIKSVGRQVKEIIQIQDTEEFPKTVNREKVCEEFYEIPISEEEKQMAEDQIIKVASSYQNIYKQSEKGEYLNVVLDKKDILKCIEAIGNKGYPVTTIDMNTNMKNNEQPQEFFEKVQRGENADTSIYLVNQDGGIAQLQLIAQSKEISILETDLGWDDCMEPEVSFMQKYKLYDWKYTEKGYFIYNKYMPPELEEIGETSIRIKPIEESLRKYCEQYLLEIGYQGNNLFIENWNQSNFKNIEFNDLFEYIYLIDKKQKLNPENYPDGIPKQVFEEVITKYFNVSAKDLRKLAVYNEKKQTYEWHELNCSNYTPNIYYVPVPEVIDVIEHDDDKMTLVVDAIWIQHETDRAFQHMLTIQKNKDGSFKYIANKIVPHANNIFPRYSSRCKMAAEFKKHTRNEGITNSLALENTSIKLSGMSLDEFTKQLNSSYYKLYKKKLLKDSKVWCAYDVKTNDKMGTTFQEYIYRRDENSYLNPEIIIGLSKENTLAYITITQSNEYFTEATSNLFKSYVMSVTQLLFPTLKMEQVETLYSKLNVNEHWVGKDEDIHSNKIYSSDDIGCYSYFKCGESNIRFETIPWNN